MCRAQVLMTALPSHWNVKLSTDHVIHEVYYKLPMTHEIRNIIYNCDWM